MSSLLWKNSATAIVLSKIPKGISSEGLNARRKSPTNKLFFDYRLLLLKRNEKSSFFPNSYVFPGGAIDGADFSPQWKDIFKYAGADDKVLRSFSNEITGPRPPLIEDSWGLYKDEGLPPDIAFRICAIRETFEESGILIAQNQNVSYNNKKERFNSRSLEVEDSMKWRNLVHNDAYNFIRLCSENSIYPDIWSLYEWSNWMTPINVGKKRYDTMFYVHCMKFQPTVTPDGEEIKELQWLNPEEALNLFRDEEIWLPPPQQYEMSRFYRFSRLDEVASFAVEREKEGLDRWLPVHLNAADGRVFLFPGDDLYPSNPDLVGTDPVPETNRTLQNLFEESNNIHRCEFIGPYKYKFHCNIKLGNNHVGPSQELLSSASKL